MKEKFCAYCGSEWSEIKTAEGKPEYIPTCNCLSKKRGFTKVRGDSIIMTIERVAELSDCVAAELLISKHGEDYRRIVRTIGWKFGFENKDIFFNDNNLISLRPNLSDELIVIKRVIEESREYKGKLEEWLEANECLIYDDLGIKCSCIVPKPLEPSQRNRCGFCWKQLK